MKIPAVLLTGVVVSVTSGIALAMGFGGLTPVLAACSLALGAVAGLAAGFFAKEESPAPLDAWTVLMLCVFGIAAFRAFFWLLFSTGDSWRILSPYNLGDLSMHLQFIRYFAAGAPFWPESPILSGAPLSYPVGSDFFNSLLSLAGLPVERGLIWTGLAGAALTGWALWRWGGAFAIAAFLFNGGLLGFAIFQTGELRDFQSEAAWKNLFLTMLVPQRGLLYALPCGLLLLRCWRDDFFRNGSGLPRVAQYFLYCTMPLFSVHAFLFLSLALASIFVFQVSARWRVLTFVLLAIPPATAAVWFVTGGFSAASGLRWLPGWMQGEQGAMFWILNFGVLVVLVPILAWKSLVRGNAESRAFGSVAIGTFLLCAFVVFAPWEWDNTKLLLWAWLAAAPLLWERVIAPLPALIRVGVCGLLFFSGAVSLVGGLDRRHGYDLASRTELANAAKALEGVPPLDRIAVDPRFNHPAILLGRPVVCGYEGHLWSHGLDYRETLAKLRNVMAAGPGWISDARDIGAKWILPNGPNGIPARVPEP